MPALIRFTSGTNTPLDFQSTPAPLPFIRPSARGNDRVLVIHWPKTSPLKWYDYDRGFDWNFKSQDTNGSQTLANWFYNVTNKSEDSFTASIKGVDYTVQFSPIDGLKFERLDEENYVGSIVLSIVEIGSVTFSLPGETSLTLPVIPAPAYDPGVDTAIGLTKAGTLYSQKTGVGTADLTLKFTEEFFLKRDIYVDNYDPVTRTQDADTQSLCNWFENIAVGALNSFTATIVDRFGNSNDFTVNFMNFPTLGFITPDGERYIGEIKLRVQR